MISNQPSIISACLGWKKILQKKGLSDSVIDRIRRLYSGGITIPVVNSILGTKIENTRHTLCQGDCPSSIWLCYGIDPFLVWLGRRLQGISIHSSKVFAPLPQDARSPMPNFSFNYKVVGFCDDVKPAIATMDEFRIADLGAKMFEMSSVCRLHRDPKSNKCKLFLLG